MGRKEGKGERKEEGKRMKRLGQSERWGWGNKKNRVVWSEGDGKGREGEVREGLANGEIMGR